MTNTGNVIRPDASARQPVNIDSDLSDKNGYAVNLDTTDQDVVNAATDASAICYPLVDSADGSSTTTTGAIATAGQAEYKLGGTVAPGDKLAPTTGSVWIKTTTDTDHYGGIARKAGVTGDLIPGEVRQGMVAG